VLDALLFTKTSPLLSALYPDCLWKVKEESKVIYLTFDDGPIPEITPWVLDCMQEHQAKATFFCIGKNVEAHPDIFKRIVDEGHAVGNHTFDHLNGWKTNNEDYYNNIAQCDATLAKHGVQSGALFRPPYGKLTLSQYLHLKKQYKIIMWDVLSFDFD
jgi:peptidoglycan/xylan/chitin deacetylase (PgdA/CDA1 family)